MKRHYVDLTALSSDEDNCPRKSIKNVSEIESLTANIDCRIRLSWVDGLAAEANRDAVPLRSLLSMGDLKSMVQINYMIDIGFLMATLPVKYGSIPILCIHGMSESQFPAQTMLPMLKHKHPNVTFHKPQMPFTYGTHHTKAMMLFYQNDTLHFVVHTANLVRGDWGLKTQGIWISPLLELKQSEMVSSEFENTLVDYLSCYGNVTKFLQSQVRRFDFGPCRAHLIPSVPGRHVTGEGQRHRYGHMKVRQILVDSPSMKRWTFKSTDLLVFQSSSVGNLGYQLEHWWGGEMLNSFTGSRCWDPSIMRMIYPSVDNVQNSFEGYDAGECLPFDKNTYAKISHYLRPRLCSWKAKVFTRTRAIPHIKTYCLTDPDTKAMPYFILTSANLSKAAWGLLEKQGSQLFIRNYELGILLTPDLFDSREYLYAKDQAVTAPDAVSIAVPYDIPTVKYTYDEHVWNWNENYPKPDIFGRQWLVNG